MPVERITVNIGGKIRRESLHGRQYVVAPAAVLEKDAVLNGSDGPGLYPEGPIIESVPTWNHKPLVIMHPSDGGGQTTSACDPVVLETQGCGIILNTSYDGKLRMEAWLDETLANSIDDRVIAALDAGVKVECSTGVIVKRKTESGKSGDVRYNWVAKKMIGDHLAILPDGVGAYSIKNGGGLLTVNGLRDRITYNRKYDRAKRKEMAQSGHAMKDGSFPIGGEDDLHHAVRAVGRAKKPAKAKKHIITRARDLGLMNLLPTEWQLSGNMYLAANELTFSDTSWKISEALGAKHGEKGKYWNGYVCEVYPDRVVYWDKDRFWMQTYTAKADVVTLTGSPVEVKKVFQAVTNGEAFTANASGDLVTNRKETKMAFDKAKHIAGLIGNGFEESDRQWLEGQPDAQLEKIKPAKAETTTNASTQTGGQSGATTPANNTGTQIVPAVTTPTMQKAVTLNDIIANTAKEDPNAARMLQRVANNYVKERAKKVERIKAVTNKFSDAVLTNMDDDTLDAVVEAVVPDQQFAPPGGGGFGQFFGQTGVVGNANPTGNAGEEQPLGTPSMHAD